MEIKKVFFFFRRSLILAMKGDHGGTVDGSEILRSAVEVGSLFSLFPGLSHNPRFLYILSVVVWDFWTINSSNLDLLKEKHTKKSRQHKHPNNKILTPTNFGLVVSNILYFRLLIPW